MNLLTKTCIVLVSAPAVLIGFDYGYGLTQNSGFIPGALSAGAVAMFLTPIPKEDQEEFVWGGLRKNTLLKGLLFMVMLAIVTARYQNSELNQKLWAYSKLGFVAATTVGIAVTKKYVESEFGEIADNDTVEPETNSSEVVEEVLPDKPPVSLSTASDAELFQEFIDVEDDHPLNVSLGSLT